MIKFFFHPSPNPLKVALFLEEAKIPYELIPVDTRKGQQHDPEFVKINPNAKTPAILDGDIPVLTVMQYCYIWRPSMRLFCQQKLIKIKQIFPLG